MSGIFGIFNRNGKPVEKRIVDTMDDAMSYWRPDEQDIWMNGPVALGHGMLWNTPESKYEHLPLKDDVYVLTMDARIDNRDELAKEIELPDKPFEIGDSEFILGAYKKWGEECPKYLLGDFAFAIWDEKKQQLFCARDHVGVKQFYYHLSDDLFTFANDLRVLTKHKDISEQINDEAVANYIVNNQLLSNKITFFEEIIKLPPAHIITISHATVNLKCYWRLEDAPKVKLPNAEAYAKKLRKLLEEAVYARMRSDYPITSHLSGGLDSSSIAVLAARKLKEKGEKLLAFNWLHEPTKEDDPSHYEWANSKQIADIEGIDHNYVPLTAENIYKYMKKHDIAYGETATFWYEYPVRNAAQKRNSRTILSGWGGDELTSYHGQAFYSDLFLKGRWIQLFKESGKKVSGKNNSFKLLLQHYYYDILIPIIPKIFHCLMPKIKCHHRNISLLDQSILKKIDLVNKKNKKSNLSTQPNRTVINHMLAYWNNMHIQSRIEAWGTVSRIYKIDYSYPLLDKCILEFIMSIPAKYYIQDGFGRNIFRLSIKDLLPEEIYLVQKVYEPNRVSNLVKMMLSIFNMFLMDSDLVGYNNKYLNLKKITTMIENIDSSVNSRETLERFEALETSISLLFSEKIN